MILFLKPHSNVTVRLWGLSVQAEILGYIDICCSHTLSLAYGGGSGGGGGDGGGGDCDKD